MDTPAVDAATIIKMLGGMIVASIDVIKVRAAEYGSGYPFLVIALICIRPVLAISATDDPAIPAKIKLAITFTCPRPPFIHPTILCAKSKILSATPPSSIMIPAKMNNGTATIMKLFIELNMD